MCDKGDCRAKDGHQPNKASGIDKPGAFQVLEVSAFNALEHQVWPCGECCFFMEHRKINLDKSSGAEKAGFCVRRAPIWPNGLIGSGGRGSWPLVLDIDFCGESKPNAEILAKMREDERLWGIKAAEELVAAGNAAQLSSSGDDPNEGNTTL